MCVFMDYMRHSIKYILGRIMYNWVVAKNEWKNDFELASQLILGKPAEFIYKCESCGKSFCDAGILRMHIHTVHDGHKDHKCKSCGKSFTGKPYLRKHTYPYNSWKQQRL